MLSTQPKTMMQGVIAELRAANDDVRGSVFNGDVMTQGFIPKKVAAGDLDLFSSKWFDYRQLTSFEATKIYIDQYGAIYRRIYAKNLDKHASQFIRVVAFDELMKRLSDGDTKSKSDFTAYWRGRQEADRLGMLYEDYIELAFHYRLRFWNRAHLPQPQHLYHEADILKIAGRWQEMQRTRLYSSDHPAYLIQNYAGIGAQNDHHEWLINQAGLRADQSQCLAQLINDDLLPASKVEGRVDAETMAQVSALLH